MKKKSLSALLIAGLLLPGAAVSQKFTLRTETEVVLVNVSVSDRDGNFVRDVKKEDFTISEDGKKQEIVRLQASLGAGLATTANAQAARRSKMKRSQAIRARSYRKSRSSSPAPL